MRRATVTDVALSQDFFPHVGGAHAWLYEVYRRWPTSVTFLVQDYSADAADAKDQQAFDVMDHGALHIVRERIAIEGIDLSKLACWRKFITVARRLSFLNKAKTTRLHCLRAFPEGFAGLLAKLRRPFSTRLIVYAHGEEILVAKSSGQLRLMATCVYRYADLIIANSKNTEALVRSLVPGARVVCVHPGVDVARYRCDPAEVARFRQQWGWALDTVIVTTIARMEPRKNQAAIIECLARLRREGVPLAYVCCGDGPERARLMQLAADLGVQPWVCFPGKVSDAEKVLTYAAADIHAMPSIQYGEMIEGFGIVFLEAAAAGIPSICGRVGGQQEAVADGRTGIVVDGSDREQLQRALSRLARDNEVRRAMGQEGVLRAQHYDWERVTRAIRDAVGAASH